MRLASSYYNVWFIGLTFPLSFMGWQTACTTHTHTLARRYSMSKSNLLPSLPQHALAHWHQKGCWEPINQCWETQVYQTFSWRYLEQNTNTCIHNTWQQVLGRSSWCRSGPSDGRVHSQTAACPPRLSLCCTAPSDLASEHSLAGSGSVQLQVRPWEWVMQQLRSE